MKKKTLIIALIVISMLVVLGVITKYVDGGRVSTNNEPKYCIKIVSNDGSKVTYWGLGYKVVRYISVSPSEPYKNNIGSKMGSWFMNYELADYKSINIELLMEGKTIKITKRKDIETISSILRDSKYISELCNGINTHKIILDNEIYNIKEGCKAIQKGNKQAEITKEDFEILKKIIEDYNETKESVDAKKDDEQYEFEGTIIKTTENSIIVKPNKDTNEIKSSDKISVNIIRPTNGTNDFYVVGNKVKITYNGIIMESYPAQIVATKIELVK